MVRKAKPKPKRDDAVQVRERTASEVVRDQMQGYANIPSAGRTTLYGGICDGGPHHGRPLYHGTPVFPIARLKEGLKPVTWFGNETDLIRIDEYRHQDGRWIWSEKS